MLRSGFRGPVALVGSFVVCFAMGGNVARGQEAAAAEAAAGDAAAKLPIKRVVLFNSGVGYFQHQGTVSGNATVDLKFRVDDVNDLLKSMVLEDLGGGQISTISYGSRDPVTKTLRTFAIDLTTNPTLGALLAQIRGEQVEVNAPTAIRGTIVGVEKQRQVKSAPGSGETILEVELLNLLTEEGLRRIPLDSVNRIRLVNPELDAEFRQALAVLATSHSTDKKSVTLNFLGQGDRNVRVGYIHESPVWKTSYRLVLDKQEKPFLQGWAIVENTTDTDWEDVNLSLVSGRPISFTMDLYSPLYAARPLERMEMYASLRPQVYDQDLARQDAEFAEAARLPAPTAAPAADSFGYQESGNGEPAGGGGFGGGGGGRGGRGGRGGGRGAATQAGRALTLSEGLDRSSGMLNDAYAMDMRAAVQAAAQGGDVGELFKYDIQTPVTIARQRSAMLPIINQSVDGEKLSIYNANVHPQHPLNGVRLKNSSKLHLMQGPITVFDGGVYAGDAKIPDLPPGSERLLSYALDLDVEVAPTQDSRPLGVTSIKLVRGTLITTRKIERNQTYVVKNSGSETKTVLIEYPINTTWNLITPKEPTEKTRDAYRFAVKAEPGKPAELKIAFEQPIQENIAIANLNTDMILNYVNRREISDEVKQGLREVIRRKTELAEMIQRRDQANKEIATITEDQARIRPIMNSIDRASDLYARYLRTITDQEDKLVEYREQVRTLDTQIQEAQNAFNEYLANLDLG